MHVRVKTSARIMAFLLLWMIAIPAYALSPNDPLLAEQWYLDQIGAQEAWNVTTGSEDVVVAVLDTGVDLDHPDFQGVIWENQREIPGDDIDNDHNGYIDDVHGWDFIDDDNTPIPNRNEAHDEDAVPHGTLIAGVIGAVGNNNEGIAGLNWKTKIMPVRILDNVGSGDSLGARRAVEYAVANGADVINLSFTGFDAEPHFQEALRIAYEAGVVVVAAVGNAKDGGIDINSVPIYPVCYGEDAEHDWIIGVSATDLNDEKTSFSNYGDACTDIAAPGIDIFGVHYHDDAWEPFSNEYYAGGWAGTSMAAPMVSGAVALLRAAHPSLTPSQIKTVLQLSVDPLPQAGSFTGQLGAGRLNIGRALEVAETFSFSSSQSDVVSVSPSTNIVVVPEGGSPPTVRVFSKSGQPIGAFNAYDDAFDGGVRVAVGDVDGDGYDEIVTVPGSGGPQVRVFEQDGTLLSQFFAFNSAVNRGGLYVSTGDIQGDGTEEIVVSTDAGGTGHVRIFDLSGAQISQFFPFGQTQASLRVTMGDVNGDGYDEVITTRGEDEPLVRIHTSAGVLHSEFLAYASTYHNGVFVASGDLDADGDDEIVTGTDNGGGPQVQIFDGTGKWLGTFFAYDPEFRGGVRIAVGHLDENPDGQASIITAAGPGGGPHIQVFTGRAQHIGTFFSDDAQDREGVNVGSWGK